MENEQKNLSYTVKEDAYVFFYGEEILFFNSKSNPFLYITLEREGVKKQLPLYYCNITKFSSYGYKIKFYNKNCAVNLKITAVKNTIFFEFVKLGFFGETLSINLYRKNSKIKGMGLNQYKDINNLTCDKEGFSRKKEYCDTKPAFSIKNGYFFKINDVEDYQLSFYGSSIRLNTKQNVGQFYLEFEKLYYFGDKEKNKIRFCEPKEIEKYIKTDPECKGFILDYKPSEDFFDLVKKTRKKGYKIYIYLHPTIHEKDIDFSLYNKDGLIQYNDEYLIDENYDDNKRVYQNKIRGIFDHNIDGLYIDEKDINYQIKEDEKTPYIGRILHNDVYKITKEYTAKKILYNKLYLDEKNNEVFSVRYSKIKKKEKDYQKSLTYTSIDNVYYEFTEKEYEKYPKGKTQVIIR